MFTKNFKNMLAGFGMPYLNYSTSGITLKTRAGAKRYLLMNGNSSYYAEPCQLISSSTFASGSSSTSYSPIHLDWACTAHGDGSNYLSRCGLIFSDASGVTEDSYILPGNEFFPLSKFSIAIKSRQMIAAEDSVQFKIVYTLTSTVNTDTIIGSLGYYTMTRAATSQGDTSISYGQYLMIAIDLAEPVTIPATGAADLTVTINANGQAWAEIT